MRYAFGAYDLDTEQFELRHDSTPVPVEPQVFDVLAYLVEHHDRVVTKEELLDNVWGDRFVSESALTSRIKAARRAVGDDGQRQHVIRTFHGRGYRFVAEPTAARGVADRAVPSPGAEQPPVSPQTRYARTRDHAVAYQVVGEGPETIVFIPGFVSNLELQWVLEPFAAFFQRLSSMGRLVLFDKYGTGLSDRLGAGEMPTLEARMDDVRVLLDEIRCERATVFGASEGGPMALLFAATHPQRVERLVLYGTYAHHPFGTTEQGEDFAVRAERYWGTGTAVGLLSPSTASDPEQRRRFARYEINSATPRGAAELLRLTNAMDVRSTLPAVRAPTLVLHRTDDEIIPVDRARELAAGIEGATLVELEGADHLPFAGDTGAFLDAVERFLSDVAPAATAERHLATIVLFDVGGAPSTEVRHLHHRTVTDHDGRPLQPQDDHLIAIFDGPARAVRAARAAVAALGAAGGQGSAGVHTAEIEVVGATIDGPGVDVAAWVTALAPPGEVWVSRTVRDLVAGSGLDFADRGVHELEGAGGLHEAWQLFAAS
jgi:pimeloyl-ACP methyl ester carboxylesterase